MRAGGRGAHRKVIEAAAAIVLIAAIGLSNTASGDQEPTAEELAGYASRYRAALGDLWNGKPLLAIEPLHQLVLDDGCHKHKCEMRLAQAYRYIGELAEAHRWALEAVARAERKGLTGAEEHNELGLCLFEMARTDSAMLADSIDALRKSVERHRGQGDTYLYNLSQVLLAAGSADEAGAILGEFQDSRGLRPIIEKGEAVLGEYRRLEVTERKYAEYTLEARQQGTEGQILLRAVIDANGKVAQTEVIHGLPNGLTEAALKALKQTRFRPAMLNGEPVAAIYHQSVDMRLTPGLVSQRQIAGDGRNR